MTTSSDWVPEYFKSTVSRGQLKSSPVARLFGKTMGAEGGSLWPAHDLQCESIQVWVKGKAPEWTPCDCLGRKNRWLASQPRIKVRKQLDPRKGYFNMWQGWCLKCDKRVAQYWDFGAALGASLEHQRRCR
jgi:hypothetical protein